MASVILSVNAGSSSLKVTAYTLSKASVPAPLASKEDDNFGGREQPTPTPTQVAEAQIGGLTAPPATLSYSRASHKFKGQKLDRPVESQDDAFKYLLDYFIRDDGLREISRAADISVVCHRIVHGGDFDDAHVIDPTTLHRLEELTDLAPLHNAPALSIVRSCLEAVPGSKNVAYFDSAFHRSLPDYVRTYPIDPTTAQRNKLRKYGFHGISYAFILRSVAHHLGKSEGDTNLIVFHLGSGASACAIKNGRSYDTSMGLTPLAGLPGATRSGDIDPSLVFHFTHDAGKPSPSSTKGMHISTAEEILNKKSGWKALTGTSDFGKIAASDDERCRLAFDIFVDRILAFLGAYYVKLEGEVDALVFAGGIGEKSAVLRARVVAKCAALGFDIDAERNEAPPDTVVAEVGSKTSRRTVICQTDEQFEMALQCSRDASLWT